MLSSVLPKPVIGVLTVMLMVPALLLWTIGTMIPGILLKLVPVFAVQRAGARYCVWCARRWVGTNQLIFRLLHELPRADGYGELSLDGTLDPSKSYLLVSNHQSWADILVLFNCFHGRVPFLRFFLKQDLIYVPIIGVVCWAMDFPFMTRRSGAADIATTRRACEVYKLDPVTVVNFLEGTRFTEAKHAAKQSPFKRLLRPKAAGLSYTLNAMGEQFEGLIDVTVVYRPTTRPLVWSWLCGEQNRVRVVAAVKPLPAELFNGDYAQDASFRSAFQAWVNALWTAKDAALGRLRPSA
ncbi:MAG: acetyltransferase [Pseudomonadota bacterium]